LIDPALHLTGPCWSSFRKHVISKGATVTRHKATLEERAQVPKDKNRSGTLYFISATIPVHPSKTVAHAKQAKQEAARKAEEREKKTQEAAKRKEEREHQHQQAVQEAYNALVVPPIPPESVPSVASLPPAAGTPPAPSKKRKNPPKHDDHHAISPQDILEHAGKIHKERLKGICISIFQQEQEFQDRIREKKRDLEIQAKADYERAKQIILDASSVATKCCVCQKDLKVAAGACIIKNCTSSICADCLKHKTSNRFKCNDCERDGAIVQNYVCPTCSASRTPEFAHCWNDCGYSCPAHTKRQKCCVCGDRNYCSSCSISQCGTCGANLCQRCEFKEGCMCSGTTGRERLMRDLGEFY
jgi:hypothetical protein